MVHQLEVAHIPFRKFLMHCVSAFPDVKKLSEILEKTKSFDPNLFFKFSGEEGKPVDIAHFFGNEVVKVLVSKGTPGSYITQEDQCTGTGDGKEKKQGKPGVQCTMTEVKGAKDIMDKLVCGILKDFNGNVPDEATALCENT